ncbi:MAG TPA: OmpA family protein [Arenimonas sp.]|uniref:OmpA family protein n=1 Tax=Arenimonas sp. TaxID=1872635 RepID=UPI002D807D21|nr:OmpA family protein [Arenimonas sp.]HEU0151710.1 OmpA family protein [Arenimonas sp.]
MRPILPCLLMPLLLALSGPGLAQSAADHEQAVARLAGELRTLETDPSLADLAGLERLKARQAVAAAADAKRRERELTVRLAGLRIAAARAAAEADLLASQSLQLDRERDQIMVEASRREAEQARRETERLRLQSLAREEAAQRELEAAAAAQTIALEAAEAETAQARKLAQARAREAELARKEAELAAAVAGGDLPDAAPPPSRRDGSRTVHTLAGNAFGSGSASLTAQAQASLRALAANLSGSGAIRIEGHTDSQGADAANQALSQRRADAVRRALEDAGVAASRMKAVGKGEGSPVADNASAAGRASNRRVEIIEE